MPAPSRARAWPITWGKAPRRRHAACVDTIALRLDAPGTIKTDNRKKYISKTVDRWAYQHEVKCDFSRRGKPTDIPIVESVNGRLRQDCMGKHALRTRNYDWGMAAHCSESHLYSALDWSVPFGFALLH